MRETLAPLTLEATHSDSHLEQAMTVLREWEITNSLDVDATIVKLNKINTRAAKQGLDGRYSWTVTEKVERRAVDPSEVNCTVNGLPGRNGQPVETVETVVTVLRIEGEVPSLNGWRFIAALENDPEVGIFTRPAPGFEGVIDRNAIRPGECDHCKTNRARSNTYLVENAETGERVQVGSACVKDFIGHSFNASWVRDDDLEEIERGGWAYVPDRFPPAAVIKYALATIRTFGWVPASQSWGGNRPTRDIVHIVFSPRGKYELQTRDEVLANLSDNDDVQAEVLLEWARAQEGSEYLNNLAAAAKAATIPTRLLGILCSLPAAYDRAQGKERERKQAVTSEFVGTVKERREFTVTVNNIRYIPGDYGTTVLYLFADEAGNTIKWFSSRNAGLEPGKTYTLKATIKEHSVYEDKKSTVITRAAVLSPASA